MSNARYEVNAKSFTEKAYSVKWCKSRLVDLVGGSSSLPESHTQDFYIAVR